MTSPSVADCLMLDHGVSADEFDHVASLLGRLDDRLRTFNAGSVTLHLSVKERDTPSQRTTLEARIARTGPIVATSEREDLDAAIAEVRDSLVRQITDATNRREPKNNPALRDKT